MTLKNALRQAAAAVLALAATASQAALITIDFDALSTGDFAGPATEDGFTLTATGAAIVPFAGVVSGFSGPNYIGPENLAAGNWVLTLVESDASAFEFLGLAGSSIQVSALGGSLTVRGFQGTTLVGTDGFVVFGSNPATIFNASALSGLALTKVEIEGQFVNGQGISVFADNIRLEPDVAAVPEPATLALFGLGVAGLGAARRKRRAA